MEHPVVDTELSIHGINFENGKAKRELSIDGRGGGEGEGPVRVWVIISSFYKLWSLNIVLKMDSSLVNHLKLQR